MPAVVKTLEQQVQHATMLLDRCANDLDRYIYLMGLQDRNERLFYKVLSSDISRMMPLVYSEYFMNTYEDLRKLVLFFSPLISSCCWGSLSKV